jgi:hypothetical protein
MTFTQMVQNLSKSGQVISDDLNQSTENKVLLLTVATAAIQQAFALDQAKKQAIYNKPLGMVADGIDLTDVTSPLGRIQLSPEQADLLHMAVGVAGEAGELLHAVMSHILNAEPIDHENMVEELGDLEFFLEGVRLNQQITRDETISHNMNKLGVRYQEGTYSDSAAQLRADKI